MKTYLQYITEMNSFTKEKIISYLENIFQEIQIKLGSKEHPDIIYYYKQEIIYFELITEINFLWVNPLIWNNIEKMFSGIYSNVDIRRIIQEYFQNNLNISTKNIKKDIGHPSHQWNIHNI